MAPPSLSTISPNQSVPVSLNMSLGDNFNVYNSSTGGVDIGALQLKSSSTLNSVGLNISSQSGSSKLTISSAGDVNTNGYINAAGSITSTTSLNSTSINVKNLTSDTATVFTVSDTGKIIASDNLSIGSHFDVTAVDGSVASGSLSVTGTVDSSGTVSIGGSSIVLGNDGSISAINNLSIGTNNFNVTASSGNVAFVGDLAIASDKFTVSHTDGSIVSKGTFNGLGDLAINTDKFNVVASSGDVAFTGDLAIAVDKFTVSHADGSIVSKGTFNGLGDLAINTDKFNVVASSGDVAFTGDLAIATDKFTVSHTDGSIVSKGTFSGLGDLTIATDKFTVSSVDGLATSSVAYSSYQLPESATDILTTAITQVKPSTISSTSKYLTTQEYVDTQLWQQTERINTLLGVDSTIIDNFNNVYKLVDAFAGHSDTVVALQGITDKYDGLVDRSSEIITSVSTVVAQAYNTVPVACSPSVWADECSPLPVPSSVSTSADGWFFQNMVASSKINWYLPTNGSNMTIGNIHNMYLNAFIGSSKSVPFLTIFTKPKVGANNYASWAGAKINYYYNFESPSTSFNKQYCLYTHTNPMNNYNVTGLKCTDIYTENGTNKNSSSSKQTIDFDLVSLTDEILYIAINTDSGAAQNDVKFVANSLNICLKTGTTQFTFSNNGPSTNFMFLNTYKMNINMSAVTLKNINMFKAYKSTYLNVAAINDPTYVSLW